MCRVCLTKSTNTMYDLTKVIEDITESSEKIPIVQALQIVTSSTIILHPKFPQYICPLCMSVLKMAYSFIIQFKESQATLEKKLNIESFFDNEEDIENKLERTKKNLKGSEVELIVDNKKYDLGDIMYIENDQVGETRFDSFISKLGKEITATFVGQKREEPKLDNADNAITILMRDNNSIVPVRELQIDETTNEIRIEVESDNDSVTDLKLKKNDDDDLQDSADDLETDNDTEHLTIIRESSQDHTYSDIRPSNSDDCDDSEFIDSLIIGVTGESVSKRRRRISRKMNWHKREVHHACDRIYECRHCQKQFTTRSACTSHTQRHLGKRFPCELCGRSYYTKQHLKEHLDSHLDKQTYLCSVCGKGCKQKSGLAYHMLLHTDEKKYQCTYCARQFRMLQSLRRHERTHTGEKPFQCRFCDRPFGSKSEVAAHENTHTGFRPYLCKFCHKGFTKTYNLKLHLLQHSGPHACHICDRSFIQNPILLWHYRISHKDVDVDLSGWKLSDYFVRGSERVCVQYVNVSITRIIHKILTVN
nr:unnamed protein product [Callosobruchus analis]